MRGFVLLSAAVLTVGCTQLLPSSVYREYALFGQAGYEDRQISEGEWEVTYMTDITDRDNLAARYARYRAAELAHQAGYPFFQIVREEGTSRVGTGVSSTHLELTVRGARSGSERMMCESKPMWAAGATHRAPCEMHSTADALRRFEPLKRRGQPSAAAPDTLPG
jgi:hypothetical protein